MGVLAEVCSVRFLVWKRNPPPYHNCDLGLRTLDLIAPGAVPFMKVEHPSSDRFEPFVRIDRAVTLSEWTHVTSLFRASQPSRAYNLVVPALFNIFLTP